MKHVFLCLLGILFVIQCTAQSGPGIEYLYTAGYRTKRWYKPNIAYTKQGVNGSGAQADTMFVVGKDLQREPNNTSLYLRSYPNPVNDVMYVENFDWKDGSTAILQVTDISGKLILKKSLNKAKEQIITTDLIPGTYNATYYVNGANIITWKLVKL